MREEMQANHAPFYLQFTRVSSQYVNRSRLDVFREFCEGKMVLHVGCAQYPLTDPRNSLHILLADHCKRLDGYDVRKEMYSVLAPHIQNGAFLDTLENVGKYDVVLIPEVLEHVGNVEEFLAQMSAIPAERYILTVPDLFQCFSRHFWLDEEDGLFIEAVHPDHNCWYSAYTIRTTISKYTSWEINGIFWFNRISLLVDCLPSRKSG